MKHLILTEAQAMTLKMALETGLDRQNDYMTDAERDLIASAKRLVEAGMVEQEPACYSVTYDGEITNNIFRLEEKAQQHKEAFDKAFPGVRTVLALYAGPVPPVGQQELIRAAVLAEREACAKMLDTVWNGDADMYEEAELYNEAAAMIRART